MKSTEISSLARESPESNLSPMEVLLQITLALIPVLAIAVVTLNTIQTKALDALQGGLRKYDAKDMHELVIEIERQKLISRYEEILDGYEERLSLAVFTVTATDAGQELVEQFAVDEDGYPRDPRFQQLCAESQSLYNGATLAELSIEAYIAALKIDDDGETLFDSQHRPHPTETDGPATVSLTNRGYTLSRIRERIAEFREKVVSAQLFAVESVLLRGVDDSIVSEDEEVIKQNLRDAFASRDLPLLSDLFSE